MATKIRSQNFSTDADDYIKLTAKGLGRFAASNFPTSADAPTATGANALAIGRDATAGHTNSVAVGYGAVTNANNQVRLGGTTISSIRVGNINYDPSDSQDLATKGYVDSQISATIDSSYISARASSFDSGNATGLIDSAYIQARQVDLQRDSGFVTGIIDSAYVTLRSKTIDDLFTVSSTQNNGPAIKLVSDDPTDAADYSAEGQIQFFAENSASQSHEFAAIKMTTADITDGTEDGRLTFNVTSNGSLFQSHQMSDRILFLMHDQHHIQWQNTRGTNFDIKLNTTTPTADRTITLPDATGTVALTSDITSTIDSAYVSARAGGGIDSAATLNIVDSSYIGTVVTTTRLPGKTVADMRVNPANISRSHTIDSTDNAMLVGPFDLDSGVTLTINGTLMVV